MVYTPDDVEREILKVLDRSPELGFSEIVESVGEKIASSSPKISRRLKRLVKEGMVFRRITEEWPPRTIYSVSNVAEKIRIEKSEKSWIPLKYDESEQPKWLADILKLDVEELLGTTHEIKDGEDFVVRGRYSFFPENIKSAEISGKEAHQTVDALRGHETCSPAAITLSGNARGRGGGFQIYPGSRPFEATVMVRGKVRGEGRALNLKMIDVKSQREVVKVKELRLHHLNA